MRERYGSEEAYRRSLAESGLTEGALKERIREQMMVQQLIDAKVRSTITVSPQEVARAIGAHPELAKPGDRVRASHLLVRVDERRSEEQARVLIEDIRRQLLEGAGFSTFAARYGQAGEEGTSMGWVAQGELMPELDAALFSLAPGEISAPIKTRLGFHLVKVEERRSATSLSLTDANRSVQHQLYQQKFLAAMTRWLEELKQKAYIEILVQGD